MRLRVGALGTFQTDALKQVDVMAGQTLNGGALEQVTVVLDNAGQRSCAFDEADTKIKLRRNGQFPVPRRTLKTVEH